MSRDKPVAEWSQEILAVAFDMDGLMLNTEDLYDEVLQVLMERRGGNYRSEVRRQMIGLPAKAAFSVLISEEGLSESWQELMAETEQIFDGLLEQRVAPMPGLLELLDLLDEKNMPRGVATSSQREFANQALRFAGVLDRVDWIVTAEDVENGKPSPDIYHLAASRFGIRVDQMIVLEDSQHGTAAGVTAGACTISVPGDHTREHSFTGACFVADGLGDRRIYSLLGD